MGEGLDYDVWYEGRIVGNVKAYNIKDARAIARKWWGRKVRVTPCKG